MFICRSERLYYARCTVTKWKTILLFRLLLTLYSLSTLVAPMAHAQQSQLMDAVEVNQAVNVIDGLHVALANLMMSDETELTARKALIGPALNAAFDMEAMSKAIIGSKAWRTANDDERNQAIAAFNDWMITQYASRFSKSQSPKFSTRETRDGGLNTIVVETVLRTKKRLVNLDYRMRKAGSDVKIIDVFLDGRVSEVALRNSEYRKLIREAGLQGFVSSLKEKTASLAGTS